MVKAFRFRFRFITLALCLVGGTSDLSWFGQATRVWAQDGPLEAAEACYQAGRYTEAAHTFQDLATHTTDRETLAFCLMRLGDCWWIGEWWPAGATAEYIDFSPDQYYALAMEVGYSDHLAEAFLKWQVVYQAWWHGLSNLSEVPEVLYRAKRQSVLAVIDEYWQEHPTDDEAQAQHQLLTHVEEIGPGESMHQAPTHMALLWPEILQQEHPDAP